MNEKGMMGEPGFCAAAPVGVDGRPDGARKERRDAAAHRSLILATARRLFAAHGVDAVSMQQIARAAAVGQGTLYRRYAHKGELCLALLGDSIARFQAEIERCVTDKAVPALKRLDDVLARLLAFNEENGSLLGAAGGACGPRREAMYHSPFYRWLRPAVQGLLDEAVAAGEIAPLDTAYSSDAILALLAIDLYLYQRHDLGLDPSQIMRGLRRLVFAGLCDRTDDL